MVAHEAAFSQAVRDTETAERRKDYGAAGVSAQRAAGQAAYLAANVSGLRLRAHWHGEEDRWVRQVERLCRLAFIPVPHALPED